MSNTVEDSANLMKMDLYEFLNVEPSADSRTIKRAYRKQALKCHPDKNPDDPKAAELFQKLAKILGILTDTEARGVYDKLLKARKASRLRDQALDGERKKLKSELLAREQVAAENLVSSEIVSCQQRLQEKINRLRKEGCAQLLEEQEAMRQQLLKERQSATNPSTCSSHGSCRVKVRWDVSKHSLDAEGLTAFMVKHGEVSAVVISKRRKGSALVEFSSPQSAYQAAMLETGSQDVRLEVTQLRSDSLSETAPVVNKCSTEQSESPSSRPHLDFDSYESLVLKNLEQAQLDKQMKQDT